MIEITRALARQLRAVLRKSVWAAALRGARPPMVLRAERDGMRICTCDPEVAIEFRLPGRYTPEVLVMPAEILDDCEGRTDTTVTLERVGTDTVQVRWDDRGVPQVRTYPARDPETLPAFPEAPERWATSEPGLLRALADATQTAARDNPRYAVHRTQLRGKAGQIVATDGRQLLVQSGFAFPWQDDLLITSVAAFTCRELSQDTPVVIGKTDTHVGLKIGPWTILLAVDKDGRFPAAENVIPALTKQVTTCRLAPDDADFLLTALARLPGAKDEHAPVTLDINGQVVVRARAEGQAHPTELLLSRSEATGPPVRLVTARQHLARAVQLGFTRLAVVKADAPVVCQDERRSYVWMPLDKSGAVSHSEDAVCITSHPTRKPTPKPMKERRTPAMPKPTTNGHGLPVPERPDLTDERPTPAANGLGALLAEAEALKEQLRDAYGRSTRLVLALKRHRQQSRQMASALASLRQLQQLPSLDG